MGERRIGKTSTLKVIISELKTQKDNPLVPLEVQRWGITTFYKLAKAILERLSNILGKNLRETGYTDDRNQLQVETLEEFEAAFLNLINSKPGANEKIYILCIDEFDALLAEADNAELNQIKGVINLIAEQKTLPLLAFLTMTACTPKFMNNSSGSPFLESFKRVSLRPFTKEELGGMIEHELKGQVVLAQPELEWLFKMSGGHPFYAKLLLASLLEEQEATEEKLLVTISMLNEALDKAINTEQTKDSLEPIYNLTFTDEGKSILLLLARHDHISVQDLEELGNSYTKAAKHLTTRTYLTLYTDDPEHPYYDFNITFWGVWLKNWEDFKPECDRYQIAVLLEKLYETIIEIDERNKKVRVRGNLLELTPKEYKLLLVLAKNIGRAVERNVLLDEVWGHEQYEQGILDTNIGRLRQKFKENKNYLKTIRGEGYILHGARIIGADK
jgi:DNA-binding winged helix-turn-helix (wHTH) protein